MSEIVVTVKADGGYDAPWVVFHGDSIAEVADQMGAAEATGLLALVAQTSATLKGHYQAGKILGATPVQSPATAETAHYAQADPWGSQNAPQAPQAAAQPSAPPQAPPGPAPQCPHGPRQWKPGGTSKNGKPYSATWNCALKAANYRDPNGCPTQWINDR